MKKTKEQILVDLEYRLKLQTDITNMNPGSVARTFLEVLTEEFYDFYDELELSATMGFVSTARGHYLDMIGMLLNCERVLGETDDNYRSRIINQVYVAAGANLTAIRLKALSVAGVRDVIFRQYSHGAGSFSCYVITNETETSKSVLDAVQAAIEDAKAFGIYAEVKSPVLIPAQLMVRLIFSNEAGTAERASIRQAVATSIQGYFDNMGLGEELILNEIIQRVMEVNSKIRDTDVYGMTVNGIERFASNVQIKWNEKFILDSLDIT